MPDRRDKDQPPDIEYSSLNDPDDSDQPEEYSGSPRTFGMVALICALVSVVALGVAAVMLIANSDRATQVAPASAAPQESEAQLAAYRNRANRICDEAIRVDELFEPSTSGQLSAVLRLSLDASVIPLNQQLAALRPPPELRAHHETMVAAGKEQVRVIEDLIAELESGADPQAVAVAAAERLDRLQLRSNRAFARLGAKRCIAPTGSPSNQENS